MTRSHSLARDNRGNAAVEFALLMPILLLLLSGLIDFGRAFFTSMELENAARAGAQYGFINGADDLSQIEATVRGASSVDDADLSVATTSFCGCPDGTVQPCAGGDCGCHSSTEITSGARFCQRTPKVSTTASRT